MFSNNTVCHIQAVQEAYDLNPLHMVLSCLILVFNSFTIQHYYTQRSRPIPLMFIAIGISDVLTALGHISLNVTLIYTCTLEGGEEDTQAKSMVALKYGFLVYLLIGVPGYTLSIFYSLVLNVVRTINIVRPLYHVEYKYIGIIMGLNATFIYIFLFCDIFGYFKIMKLVPTDYEALALIDCVISLIELPYIGLFTNALFDESISYKVYDILGIMTALFNYQIPVLIVCVCTTVQVLALRCSGHNDAEIRHVSITIIVLSILFCICNSMMSILLSVYMTTVETYYNKFGIKLYNVASNTLPLLNAVLTPVILVSRSVNMRAAIWIQVQNVTQKVRSLTNRAQRDTYEEI